MTEAISQTSTLTPDLKKYVLVPVTKHERKLCTMLECDHSY